MRIMTGSANAGLARSIADQLGVDLADAVSSRFPDGEVEIVVDPDLRDEAVYLVQPTGPPVDQNLVELLMLVDAVRRCGAAEVVAVVPYLGYARQDRRTEPGQPVGVRVVGDLFAAVGVSRVLVVDPHTRHLEAICGVPVEPATAAPLLGAAIAEQMPPDGVVVAPDLGAVNLAERYAELLDLPVALVRKTRLSGDEVRAEGVVGDVTGRHPIIVDDMISTGGTIAAAVDVLQAGGARPEATVAATHGVFEGDAGETLGELPLRRLVVSNSLPPSAGRLGLDIDVVDIGPLLADAIGRLEDHRRLDDLKAFM